MAIPIVIDNPGGGDPGGGSGGGGTGGGGGYDIPAIQPGLGQFGRRRYTCNLAITETVSLFDLMNDVILPSFRGFITQGANGKYRLHSKRPVTYGFGTAAIAAGDTTADLDNVGGWMADLSGFALLDPHTNRSEVRTVTSADYDTAQNSVTLTTDQPTYFTITGFSGCDGASTPATATIAIASLPPALTDVEIVLEGHTIAFRTSSVDTLESIGTFLEFTMRSHPVLGRRFTFVNDEVTDTLTITAQFGTLTFADALELDHEAPIANPSTGPTASAASLAGALAGGVWRVAYAWKDADRHQTRLSPITNVTVSDGDDIDVDAVTPPAGCTVCWYISPEAGSEKIRFHSENDGSAFTIASPPLLDDPLAPDQNRTGCEVMRVQAVFTDREESRSAAARSNVIRSTFEWSLSDQKKRYNRIDFTYREASDDWRRIELRVHDKAHQTKIRKVENKEVNGNATDNYYQAYRLAAGMIAEQRDANFRYKWTATRKALLVEEGDVVAITDASTGVYNLPVMVESRQRSLSGAGLPKVTFTAPIFANQLYDDSMVEQAIPVVTG